MKRIFNLLFHNKTINDPLGDNYFNNLPNDTIQEILSFLNKKELNQMLTIDKLMGCNAMEAIKIQTKKREIKDSEELANKFKNFDHDLCIQFNNKDEALRSLRIIHQHGDKFFNNSISPISDCTSLEEKKQKIAFLLANIIQIMEYLTSINWVKFNIKKSFYPSLTFVSSMTAPIVVEIVSPLNKKTVQDITDDIYKSAHDLSQEHLQKILNRLKEISNNTNFNFSSFFSQQNSRKQTTMMIRDSLTKLSLMISNLNVTLNIVPIVPKI